MNNKFIESKLEEFNVLLKNYINNNPFFVDEYRLELEQFIKEALESVERETITEERAKHRDNSCKCMECQKDNINILYNMQGVNQLPQPKERKLIDPVEFEKLAKKIREQEACRCDCHKGNLTEHTHGTWCFMTCAHCQKPEKIQTEFCREHGPSISCSKDKL